MAASEVFDLSLPQLLANALATGIVAAVLGFCMAAFAEILGDTGPRRDSRRTLDPSRHLGALGFLSGILFGMTWVRPIDLRPQESSRPRLVFAVVPVAGVAGLVLLLLAALALRPFILSVLSGNAAFTVLAVLESLATASLRTALLNLLPLPPLAAGLLWRVAVPYVGDRLDRHAGRIALGLFTLIVLGLVNRFTNPVESALRTYLGF